MTTAVSIPKNSARRRIGSWRSLHEYITDLQKSGLTLASAEFEVYDREGKLVNTFSNLSYSTAERRATTLGGRLYAVLNPGAVQI